MKQIRDLSEFTRTIASLIWRTRKKSGDSVVAVVKARDIQASHQFIMFQSDVENFNPAVLTLCLDNITNEEQLELAKQETAWLAKECPEVARYNNLMALIEDYEGDSFLREF